MCLSCTFDGVTLVPQIRKPFNVLAGGLISEKTRGDKTPLELFLAGVRSWAGGLQRPCARLIWKLRASSGQWLWTLAGADSGKSVGAPFLAANAVMDEEKSVGIVFLLHGGQPEIV